MRPVFEKGLEYLNSLAKEAIKQKETSDEDEDELTSLNQAIDWQVNFAVEKRASNKKSQQIIFDLQKQKQEIMARLHRQLVALDHPESSLVVEHPGKKGRLIQQEAEVLFWHKKDGTKEKITKGELLTDGEWGIRYDVDVKSVSRLTQKKYLIAQSKSGLARLLDAQILEDEISSDYTGDAKKRAYVGIRKCQENKTIERGLLAEKIVENFLRKLVIDYDLPFEVRKADVFADVNQKIDFLLHRIKHWRGVGVNKDAHQNQDIGIQFTISQDPLLHYNKTKQIEKSKSQLKPGFNEISDIVLVSVPLRFCDTVYDQWEKAQRPIGGPDKLLSPETKKKIFEAVMQKFLEPEEIKNYWQKIEAQRGVDS